MENLTPIQEQFIALTRTETIESLVWKYLIAKKELEKEKALSNWLDVLADYNRDYANNDGMDGEERAKENERRIYREYVLTGTKALKEIQEIDFILTEIKK